MAGQTKVPWPVRIEPGLRRDLAAIAAAEGLTAPGLARQILGRWVKRYAKRQLRTDVRGGEVLILTEKNDSASLSGAGEA